MTLVDTIRTMMVKRAQLASEINAIDQDLADVRAMLADHPQSSR